MSTHFSTTLRRLRRDHGLSQRELGEKLGYNSATAQSVISLWERGRSRGPGVDLLRRLAEVLEVHPAELIGDSTLAAAHADAA